MCCVPVPLKHNQLDFKKIKTNQRRSDVTGGKKTRRRRNLLFFVNGIRQIDLGVFKMGAIKKVA